VVEGHLGQDRIERLANGAGRWVVVDGSRLTLGDRVLLVDDDEAPITVPKAI
jgi:hypothetical protein